MVFECSLGRVAITKWVLKGYITMTFLIRETFNMSILVESKKNYS